MSVRFRPRTEIQVNGSWVDISGDVLNRETAEITRGLPDEGSRVNPGSLKLKLKNRDGKYSPRNPLSEYYGQLKRNTPLRYSVAGGPSVLRTFSVPGTSLAVAASATADGPTLDVTGDMDLRINLRVTEAPTTDVPLAHKYNDVGDQRSWYWTYSSAGTIKLAWSTDGTFAAATSHETDKKLAWWEISWLRVTVDVDNGAGGYTVTWYTSADGASWDLFEQLDDPSGVSQIFASTEPLKVGGQPPISTADPSATEIRSFEMRNGIGGAVVANPDFTQATPGASTYTDPAGNVWTVDPTYGEYSNEFVRFVGEVSSWPQSWEAGGTDRTVPLTASGILRRLGQGEAPLRSVAYRTLTAPERPTPVAYWPMEDGEFAQEFSSGIPGHPAMAISATGGVEPGKDDSYVNSAPLPYLKQGYATGDVPGYASTGEMTAAFFVHIPADGIGAVDEESVLLEVETSDSAVSKWAVVYRNGGTGVIRVVGYDANDVLVEDSGLVAVPLKGQPHSVRLQVTESGSDLSYDLLFFPIALVSSGGLFSRTVSGSSVGVARRVVVGKPDDLGDTSIGHVLVSDSASAFDDTGPLFSAHNEEQARDRLSRLCDEHGVPVRIYESLDFNHNESQPMGPQGSEPLVTLFQETAEADAGMLYESRGAVGLEFRTAQNLYNQTPALILDYADGAVIANPLEDDRFLRNDVTAKQDGGSEGRYVEEAGSLSVPDVGRYDSEITVSHATAVNLEHRASWEVHLGTWDDARFPDVILRLTKDPSIDVSGIDVGSVVRLTNMPAGLHYGDLNLLVRGYTESVSLTEREITLTCEPADPYYVWEIGHPTLGRLDTDGSELAVPLAAGATTAYVATDSGMPLWVTGEAPVGGAVPLSRVQYNTLANGAGTNHHATLTNTITEGNLLVVVVSARGAADDWTEPAGWTRALFQDAPGGNLAVFTKTAGPGEPQEFSATYSSSRAWVMWFAEFEGVSAVDITASGSLSSATTAPITSGVSTAEDGEYAIAFVATEQDTSSGAEFDNSFIETPWLAGGTGASAIKMTVATKADVPAGVLSTTATWTTANSGGWGLVTLRPAASSESSDQFPFLVQFGGEVAEVTAISGDTSPQEFTLVRGDNGINKAHAVGTRVNLSRS